MNTLIAKRKMPEGFEPLVTHLTRVFLSSPGLDEFGGSTCVATTCVDLTVLCGDSAAFTPAVGLDLAITVA